MRTKRPWPWGWPLILLAGFLTAIIAVNTEATSDQPVGLADANGDIKGRPIATKTRGYISSSDCRECHTHHYETWHSSHHRTMTQVPTKDSVIADFDNKVISHSGREFRFFHEDNEYFMEIKSSPSSSKIESKLPEDKIFKIVLSTGAHHQQSFWCETGKERTLAKIPFIWINKEQRWIPYGSIFVAPSSGLNMHAGIWNSNCIKCHVVGGQPRLDPKTGFDTHVAEFGISCEACHGPGEAHAAFHSNNLQDRAALGNQELVNPSKLSHQKSSETCGQCHAVFDFYDLADKRDFFNNGFTFRPGDDLRDTRHVFQRGHDQDLAIVKEKLKRNPDFYDQQFWSDGMVRVSGREYNGLLETACFQKGTMSCLSCHDMHPGEGDKRPRQRWADDQLKPQMRDNQACLQCHEQYKSADQLALHTHHAAKSTGSNCYNCHMPHTTLGLMKAMRSHTIDSPNVAATVATGRPNACNLCHLDKTLAWTSDHLEQWYKIPAPKLNQQQQEVASSIQWILKGDAGQRAIAGWHFGWAPAQEASGTAWMPPYLAELLTDNYDVVRFIGYHSLKDVEDFSDFEYDFVGSKEAQQQAQSKALEMWKSQTNGTAASKALLIKGAGELIRSEYDRINSQRVDPPMRLVE